MLMTSHRWKYRLGAEFGYLDITHDVASLVQSSDVSEGVVTVAVVGSTAAITTIEFEEGALKDLRRALDRIAPVNEHYEHDARWHDGNGFSHVRSALMKTSVSVPILGGELALGTWQQIVVINLDNRGRDREVVAVVTPALQMKEK